MKALRKNVSNYIALTSLIKYIKSNSSFLGLAKKKMPGDLKDFGVNILNG